MKIAVYGSKRQDAFITVIFDFFTRLARRGDTVVMHPKLFRYLSRIDRLPPNVTLSEEVPADADVAVSLGGDGSFLRTAAWVGHREIPILGVNTGHLGFLAACSIDELGDVPRLLGEGAYEIADHTLLEVISPRVEGWPFALNEVAVTKGEGASLVNVEAILDGSPLANYRADGLIISTPTGSTAYNLSVGGPIVQPSAPVFILSPIAAHSLSMRPFVIDDSSVLILECTSRFPTFRIALDGRVTDLEQGTRIVLSKAPFTTKAIVLHGHSFAQALRDKLSWE